MEKIIELLKERGFVDDLQHCVDATTALAGLNEEVQLEASRDTLLKFIQTLDEDDELLDKFFEFATDLAAEAIIKKLDLKPDENYKPDTIERLIAAVMLGKTFNNFKEDK